MTEQDTQLYNLTRRKILAGLGAVGLASAGAGLGTTAFFSDQETYLNNTLVAGALDLTVDWEEHYYWDNGEGAGLDIVSADPGDDPTYTAFPAGAANPTMWVRNDDDVDGNGNSSLDVFMDNTSLESYPDANNDRVQDDLGGLVPCDDFAQLSENLDPTVGRGAGVRSANEDTILNYAEWADDPNNVDAQPAPLVNLHDVKPGDFGELTLSLHLCDNPGYIWMNGQLVSADENGVTEPESKDPNEQDGVVELLDEIQTMLWYDEDGDNVYEPGGAVGEVDVMLVIDRSGSMNGAPLTQAKSAATSLVNALGPGAEVGLVSFATSASEDVELTGNKTDVVNGINALTAGGTTNHEAAIQLAQANLVADGRPGAHDIMVFLTDGNTTAGGDPVDDAAAAKTAGTEIFAVGFGSVNQALINALASDPDASHAYIGDVSEIETIFGQISQIIAGEECFFQGSLRTLLDLVSDGDGIPLDGDRSSPYVEITGDDTTGDGMVDANYGLGDPTAAERDPFVATTTNAIGFSWWLPVDHANEVQTDSVTFDIGFYTEQSRHNDGSGNTTPVPAQP